MVVEVCGAALVDCVVVEVCGAALVYYVVVEVCDAALCSLFSDRRSRGQSGLDPGLGLER